MEYELREKRVAVLGAGKMGGILLLALLKNNLLSPELTCAAVQHEERAKILGTKLNVKVGTNNTAVKGAEIILIAVKPQIVKKSWAKFADRSLPAS
jgi:pyrroline-5-carboxylate reductase